MTVMEKEHAGERIGFKRPRSLPATSGITQQNDSGDNIEPLLTPRAPLPSVRKTALISSPASESCNSTPSATPTTLSTGPLIRGVHGASRITKWSSMLSEALMYGRSKEEETRVSSLALRIASAVPGDRSAAADAFLVLLVNLKDVRNSKLRDDIINGQLPVEVLVHMTERDLLNPEERRKQEEKFLERSKDTDLTEIRKATATKSTLFQCPSCKTRDCTWMQKQTRSADEPMTVFCICNVCDHKWRRY